MQTKSEVTPAFCLTGVSIWLQPTRATTVIVRLACYLFKVIHRDRHGHSGTLLDFSQCLRRHIYAYPREGSCIRATRGFAARCRRVQVGFPAIPHMRGAVAQARAAVFHRVHRGGGRCVVRFTEDSRSVSRPHPIKDGMAHAGRLDQDARQIPRAPMARCVAFGHGLH